MGISLVLKEPECSRIRKPRKPGSRQTTEYHLPGIDKIGFYV
jgi:hypothetical protein